MPNHSVHKASDLAPDERMFVERWLGRALFRDETVTLNAYRPHAAPAGPGANSPAEHHRSGPRDRLTRPRRLRDEADALVDEAFAEIRGRRE